MQVSNPTREEELMKEVAKTVIDKALAGKEPKIITEELEALARSLEFAEDDLQKFLEYLQTPQGKESFKKTVRLELWKSGYRPRGWKG